MLTTKKFTVMVSHQGQSAKKAEFGIPYASDDSIGFLGIETGKLHPFAALSFIGKAISRENVLSKLEANGVEFNEDKAMPLDYFFEQLSSFKVGNVLQISKHKGQLVLEKVANRPTRKSSKLP